MQVVTIILFITVVTSSLMVCYYYLKLIRRLRRNRIVCLTLQPAVFKDKPSYTDGKEYRKYFKAVVKEAFRNNLNK